MSSVAMQSVSMGYAAVRMHGMGARNGTWNSHVIGDLGSSPRPRAAIPLYRIVSAFRGRMAAGGLERLAPHQQ